MPHAEISEESVPTMGEPVSFGHFTLCAPKDYFWAPLPDITAHEVALALPILFAAAQRLRGIESAIEKLPPNVSRHFSMKPP